MPAHAVSHLPEPLPVQTNRPFPGFSVRLLDFYQNTVVVENGTAVVSLGERRLPHPPALRARWTFLDALL